MDSKAQVLFHNMPISAAAQAVVLERIDRLDTFFSRIVRCRVTLSVPHRHHHKGEIFHVRIELVVPGGEIVINRNPSEQASHKDIYIAIRDAFNAAQRRLQDYARERRGNVKRHEGASAVSM